MSADAIARNPFYILGLHPLATRAEIERQGQKLLGMLEVGVKSASFYPTPLGKQPRDPELIRFAMAELRDPQRRLTHEVWAALPAEAPASPEAPDSAGAPGPAPWDEALACLGWGSSR